MAAPSIKLECIRVEKVDSIFRCTLLELPQGTLPVIVDMRFPMTVGQIYTLKVSGPFPVNNTHMSYNEDILSFGSHKTLKASE